MGNLQLRGFTIPRGFFIGKPKHRFCEVYKVVNIVKNGNYIRFNHRNPQLLFGGGALGGIFTWRWQRAKARAEAKQAEVEVKEKEAEAKAKEIEMAQKVQGHLSADARRQAEGGGRQPPADC